VRAPSSGCAREGRQIEDFAMKHLAQVSYSIVWQNKAVNTK